ncbi:MAG TPA: hypothetical protein PKO19_13645 [Chitinophagales bacterium]|nr:hypothetical protein [Chitinophagales bacterium]HNJ89029.1 hypothetical protein [Chitinophagales bacterium]HNK99151.1 hypothetical protein [Chitinophagales bacterium]HNM30126.1 hypothetical protein [Chitinophagales bacterium]
MKNKLLVAAVALTMVFSANRASAQAFYQGVNHLSLGVGFGGYLDYAYTGSGDFSHIPTLFASFDHGTIDDVFGGNIGIGGFVGYSSAKYNYDYLGYHDDSKWTYFAIGARGTYHYILDNENLDLYGGISIGVLSQSYDYNSNYPWVGFDPNSYYDYNNMVLYSSACVGAKYMFSESLGAFAELGWDIAWLKAGVTLGL